MKKNMKVLLLSLIVMVLWGSLFPMVKIGYAAFNIKPGSIPDILMFAGLRFFVCGLVISVFSLIKKETIVKPKAKSIFIIIIIGIFSIVLHNALTYIGLSTVDSSKTALIKQMGSLIYVCFSFLFIKSEKFSVRKIIGAVIGFSGIIAINYTGKGISFSTGDLLILGASISTVIANIISKNSSQNNSPFWIAGISQFTGGSFLLIAAVAMGARFPVFTPYSTLVFGYILVSSISAYCLWYYILKGTDLSKLFIIKFSEPLFACLFGALLLGENIWKLQYLFAFILISAGVYIGNKIETE